MPAMSLLKELGRASRVGVTTNMALLTELSPSPSLKIRIRCNLHQCDFLRREAAGATHVIGARTFLFPWGWPTLSKRTRMSALQSYACTASGNRELRLGDAPHMQDGKPQDAPEVIHALHGGIVLGFPHRAGLVRKADFQEVWLGIEPDCQPAGIAGSRRPGDGLKRHAH